MARAAYFDSVTSELAFKARFQSETGESFSRLSHLLACRVIRREARPYVLPILSNSVMDSDVRSSLPAEIHAFLRGPDEGLMSQSEHYMVRRSNTCMSLGQVWLVMAMFKGDQCRRAISGADVQEENEEQEYEEEGRESEPDDDDPDAMNPKRRRLNTINKNFVDSGKMQVGSSSPIEESSQEASLSSGGYVDLDSHISDLILENDTLRLVTCVIRHILYFTPAQDPASPLVVEFQDARIRVAGSIEERKKIVAIDNGGLCLRQEDQDKGFILMENHVAILEPGEALAANLSPQVKNPSPSMILIHAIQYYVCFLQFNISDDYVEDLQRLTPSQFLYVSSTPWFGLWHRSGREGVLLNICGLTRWAKFNYN
ncbi:uncharacterized protein BDV14DRAFT_211649 [Aspergillus stella-maris]|uniref:uncharacterized protein n=1 Tax=Aspergillus stella-maris TaxID=1810926 RepID=UPI003CCD3C29